MGWWEEMEVIGRKLELMGGNECEEMGVSRRKWEFTGGNGSYM